MLLSKVDYLHFRFEVRNGMNNSCKCMSQIVLKIRCIFAPRLLVVIFVMHTYASVELSDSELSVYDNRFQSWKTRQTDLLYL